MRAKKTFLQDILRHLNQLGGWLANIAISIYQYTISPDKGIFSYFLKGRVCAHEPHCSAYGKECFKRYGLFPGIAYSTQRILACKPAMQKTYDPSHYRVVFFSGSPIGNSFLEYLADDPRYEIVGVVTMPDKPVGRGQQLEENTIKKTAKKLDIQNIYTPTTLKKTDESIASGDIAAQLQSLQADWFFVIAYGKIIPQHILDIPTFGCINLHGSLLPKLRGASPLQSVFLTTSGDRSGVGEKSITDKIFSSGNSQTSEKHLLQTGITVMYMNEKMDEGDIVSSYAFPVPFAWTAEELFQKVEHIGPKFLADSIRELSKGDIDSKPQDSSQATYCTKITKEDGEIDLFKTPLSEVYARYRAYKIRPKIWTTRNEKTLIIEEIVCDEAVFIEHTNSPVIIGEITDGKLDKKHISLNPAVTNILLKPEGKKVMSWKDFLNGYVK